MSMVPQWRVRAGFFLLTLETSCGRRWLIRGFDGGIAEEGNARDGFGLLSTGLRTHPPDHELALAEIDVHGAIVPIDLDAGAFEEMKDAGHVERLAWSFDLNQISPPARNLDRSRTALGSALPFHGHEAPHMLAVPSNDRSRPRPNRRHHHSTNRLTLVSM